MNLNSLFSNPYFFVALAALFTFIAWGLSLEIRYHGDRKLIREFLKGHDGSSLEDVLFRVLAITKENKKEIDQLSTRCDAFNAEFLKTVQGIGLVRYNPFGNVGGDQSFSVALLNKNKDGIIITALYSREQTRIYTKPVKNGGEDGYQLSEEEIEAIKKTNSI